jgi:hypothetical protein
MIPNFIKERKENVLIIAMDQFFNIENRQINYDIVQNNLDKNMDFIFYNDIGTIVKMNKFIQFLMEILIENGIPPENFAIINFIRFQRPNVLESSVEEKIPEIIYNGLKETVYVDCFYQWFGYQDNLYNMVYNYNRYKCMFRMNEIICVLNKLLQSDILGLDNLAYLYVFYKNQPNHNYFDTFLKNVVDISSFFRKESKVCCSLMESLDF